MTDVDLFADEGPVCSEDAVGLFAGIGVGLALRELGITEHGIDNEPHVAATRERLGMATTCADITTLDPWDWIGADGLWASPPCPDFSTAGKGLGIDGPSGRLIYEPVRWVEAIRPRWVAMEQVPLAAPYFREMARRLEALGYRATVARMSAEEFGVPQTRERVYLMAHRDRAPRLPSPTHQNYVPGVPPERPANLMGLLPWVSMAEALEWPQRCASRWTLTSTQMDNACTRRVIEPAMTVPAHIGKNQQAGRWCWLGPDGELIKLTTAQGCRLMGFPHPDEVAAALAPGSKRAQWERIGNACCPPVVAAIVQALTTEVSP